MVEKKLRGVWYRSILVLIIAFSLLSLLVLLNVSDRIFQATSSELESSLIQDRMADVRYFGQMLDTELAKIRLQSYSILLTQGSYELGVNRAAHTAGDSAGFARELITELATRSGQYELMDSLYVYFPNNRYMVTTLNAHSVSQERDAELFEMLEKYPNGLFETEKSIGFWSSYPFFFPPYNLTSSRIGFAEVSRNSLQKLFKDYQAIVYDCEMMLLRQDRSIVSTMPMDWVLGEIALGDEKENYFRLQHEGQNYLLMTTQMATPDLTACLLMPLDVVMASMIRLQRSLELLKYVGCVLLLGFTVGMYLLISRPLKQLRGTIRKLGNGDLSARVPESWSYEFSTVDRQFNRMAGDLQEFIRKEYEYKLLVQESQMKQLQYQISPHFLYNTYYQLRTALYAEDIQTAERLASLLGEYLRYIVHEKNEESSLGGELRHARVYAEIQQLRFGDRIRLIFEEGDPAWQSIRMPCMIIQPLLENAFGHGMKEVLADGLITLNVRTEDGTLCIQVEDNGPSLTDEELAALQQAIRERKDEYSGGVALMNIAKRMAIAYNERGQLLVERSRLGGLSACLRIVLTDEEVQHGKTADG